MHKWLSVEFNSFEIESNVNFVMCIFVTVNCVSWSSVLLL